MVEQTGISFENPDNPTSLKFEDYYDLLKKFAAGGFGVVHVTRHKPTGDEYAVKVIDRKKLTPKDDQSVFREVAIMKDCQDVEGIVRLVDFYETPTVFYMVQVYAQGGDVFERLASRAKYTEKDARDLARCLLRGIRVLHERKIAHRDLKPENLLLKSKNDNSEILLADFGFANHVGDGLTTRCGTPSFVAPEVLNPKSRYDERVDCWSVGCLLYMLIGGYPPFQAPNHRALFRQIKGADFCFHDKYWKNVSVSAKQVIASMLTVDPRNRATAAIALEQSNWLKMKDKRLYKRDLTENFNARVKMKGAMQTVLLSVNSLKFKAGDGAAGGSSATEQAKPDAALRRGTDQLLTGLKPTAKFSEVYELGKTIYEGSKCTVWECTHKETGNTYAVKIIDRQCAQGQVETAADGCLHEVAVLNALDQNYIIKCFDFFDEDDFYYLVLELMAGGDVFDRLLNQQQYTEKDAQQLAKFLLEAVGYLHTKGICHRDIKPQNVLLKSKDDNAEIKLADFSFACRVHTPQSLTRRCGTPHYVSPEILKNVPYDQSTDMWSVGVILYVLLSGYMPFADDNQSVLFSKIRTGEYDFAGEEWLAVSDEAKELIQNLLMVDPKRRWTAKQALSCKWLKEDGDKLGAIDLTDNMKAMKKKLSLKHVAKTIIWLKGAPKAAAKKKTEETIDSLEPIVNVASVLAQAPEGEADDDDDE